jgi:transposase
MHSQIFPDRVRLVAFHQRRVPRSRRWLAVCLALMACPWLIGVAPNWLVMPSLLRPYRPFPPGPLGAGSPPSRSVAFRFHSWQHIQDPEIFLQRARPVLQLYEQATALLEQGIWVVCADEKTSIQARQAEQAPCPAIHKHPVYQSPRDIRRGALHLMAALSVADGLVYGQCHTRKRFVDFRCFVETVLLVEAPRRRIQTVALVLDNGSTHAPKQLTRWIQERATTLDVKLTMQLYWLPPNASWLDQIEIWFSLLQRKLLQPNHFCSLDALEQAILDFITHYNQTAKPLEWSYTVEKLERKLTPCLIRDVKSVAT